jgi:transposase
MLVTQLGTITRAIRELDERITQLFRKHPDHHLFESLPGAGDQLAPRLLCAFGADRSRWSEASQIQKTSGIAPVLERSGKSCWVHRRFFRPKFLCQTFHEFAGESIHRSEWAKTFYQSQRQKGKSHHSAVRILAFKWIRVIFRCWKSHTPYNETFYLDALKKRHKNG